MEPQFKFAEGEKVLCYYRALLYDAKVLKCGVEKKASLKYFIHYIGWNKKWDEWVPEKSVIKYTAENLRKQENLKNEEINRRTSQRKPKGKKPQVNDSKDSATRSGNTDSTPSTPSTDLEASESSSTVTKTISSARGLLSKENVTKLPTGKDDEKEAAGTTKKRGRPSRSTSSRLTLDENPSTSTRNRQPDVEEDKLSTSPSNKLSEEVNPSTSTMKRLPASDEDNGEPAPKRKRGRPVSKENKSKKKPEDNSDAGTATSYIKKLFGLKRGQTDD